MAARAWLHRGPARRRNARGLVPPGRCRRVRDVRFQLSRRWVLLLRCIPDGSSPHLGFGERHPRDGIGRAEPGRHRRSGRGPLHHPGGLVGQPDLGSVDEPRTHVRPRPGRNRLQRLLGLCRRAFDRSCDRGWLRVRAARVRRRLQRLRGRWIPRSNGPAAMNGLFARGHHWPGSTIGPGPLVSGSSGGKIRGGSLRFVRAVVLG